MAEKKETKKMAKPAAENAAKKAPKTEKVDKSAKTDGGHPAYDEVVVTCSCGNTFKTRSALGRKELHLEICSACHPFYTGQQKLVDTSGRVEKFKQKYARKSKEA